MNIKSILILSFIILTYESRSFTFNGYVKRNTYVTFDSDEYCVYIDKNEFTDVREIGMNVTVYNGSFRENFIYLGQNDKIYSKGDILTLIFNTTCTKYIAGEYYHYSDYYKEYTLIFNLPKPDQRYLFVSIPSFSGSYVKLEVGNVSPKPYYSTDSSDSSGVIPIVIAIAGVIVVITFVCLLLCCLGKLGFGKRRKKKYSSNSNNDNTFNSNTYDQNLNSYPSTNSYVPQPPQPNVYTPGIVLEMSNMSGDGTYQSNAAPGFSPAYPPQSVN